MIEGSIIQYGGDGFIRQTYQMGVASCVYVIGYRVDVIMYRVDAICYYVDVIGHRVDALCYRVDVTGYYVDVICYCVGHRS